MGTSEDLIPLLRFVEGATGRAVAAGIPAKAVAKAFHFADGHSEKILPAADRACEKGCVHCCNRIVSASYPEILAISEYVEREWTAEQKQEFVNRARQADIDNEAHAAITKRCADTPCPFLVENECSIYPVRPMPCRSVVSRDANICKLHFKEGNPTEPTDAGLRAFSMSLARGMSHTSEPQGLFNVSMSIASILQGDPGRIRRFVTTSPDELPGYVFSAPLNEAFKRGGHGIGYELLNTGKYRDLQEIYRQQPPSFIRSLFRMSLPPEYANQQEADELWETLDRHIAEFEALKVDERQALPFVQAFQTFTMAYAGRDVRPYMTRIMGRLAAIAEVGAPRLTAPLEKRKPGRPRLGYLSKRFQRFNGSLWSVGCLEKQNPEIETFVISLDEQTPLPSNYKNAEHVLHIPRPPLEAAEIIRGLDLDVLLYTDIGMDGWTFTLANLQLARTHWVGWGHPVTSGSPRIDAYLSSDWMEPDNGQDYYSERLIRLPFNGLSLKRYQQPVPPMSPAQLGLPENGFLIVAQSASKLVPAYDELFLRVLDASPLPVVFFTEKAGGPSSLVSRRLAHPKAIFREMIEREHYLRALQLAEASIESPAFGGGFTAVDALQVGTPVITLPGQRLCSRLSNGFIRRTGFMDSIASSPEEFVQLCQRASELKAAYPKVDLLTIIDNEVAVREMERMVFESVSN